MTGQSTAAAERSAHVARGPSQHADDTLLTEVAPGQFKLACLARAERDRDAAIAARDIAIRDAAAWRAMTTEAQIDLFAPADSGPPPGTIAGPPDWHEGFGAGLRCWCGPAIGWRDLGDLIHPHGPAIIVHQHGRLMVGLTFDLGPHRFPRPRPEEADHG